MHKNIFNSFVSSFVRFAALCALGVFASTAHAAPYQYGAAEGWYFSSNVSLGAATDGDADTNAGSGSFDSDTGFGLAIAAGYDWSGLRGEFEYAFRKNDGSIALPGGTQSTQLGIHAFMFNALVDYYVADDIYWFTGLGLGLAMLNFDAPGGSDTDFLIAYQFLTGLGYDVTDRLALTLGYRIFTTLNAEFNAGSTNYELEVPFIHSLELGMKYRF